MATLLITGVNGLLGQKVLQQASHLDFDIIGIDIHDAPFVAAKNFHYEPLDITDRRAVKNLILRHYPHYIVNTAAMTNVDACETEKEKCWRINVEGVENLIYAARKIGSRIVHISTDYVFDGKNGPYDEEDTCAPLGYYGKSKLASENALRASDLEFAILRTMVLYGVGTNVRPNFVTWLISALRAKKSVKIVTDQIGSPTLADDLAKACLRVIELEKWDLLHVSGSEIIDRYHFALKIAEVFGLDESLITPITTKELKQAAPRPLKSGFIVDKAVKELNMSFSNVEQGLKTMKKQMKKLKLAKLI